MRQFKDFVKFLKLGYSLLSSVTCSDILTCRFPFHIILFGTLAYDLICSSAWVCRDKITFVVLNFWNSFWRNESLNFFLEFISNGMVSRFLSMFCAVFNRFLFGYDWHILQRPQMFQLLLWTGLSRELHQTVVDQIFLLLFFFFPPSVSMSLFFIQGLKKYLNFVRKLYKDFLYIEWWVRYVTLVT